MLAWVLSVAYVRHLMASTSSLPLCSFLVTEQDGKDCTILLIHHCEVDGECASCLLLGIGLALSVGLHRHGPAPPHHHHGPAPPHRHHRPDLPRRRHCPVSSPASSSLELYWCSTTIILPLRCRSFAWVLCQGQSSSPTVDTHLARVYSTLERICTSPAVFSWHHFCTYHPG